MIYIRSTGNISPQHSFGRLSLPEEQRLYPGDRMRCVEPDYTAFFDAKSLRRMSRIIRMGVAAAMECLHQAGDPAPDAIITGTAYGCLEDTGVFLKRMVENGEEMLTPTAFIQSTHNTVGAQIALLLKCHAYNNTFVHRGFSFESAVLDGIMLLREGVTAADAAVAGGDAAGPGGHAPGPTRHVLVGAVDEITEASHAILSRFGLYRSGITGGEGAAFFLLTSQASDDNLARLEGLTTFYKPHNLIETADHIQSFLTAHSLTVHDIDLVITGRNGNPLEDDIYDQLELGIFSGIDAEPYKHLCGEYPTATGFALWYACSRLKEGMDAEERAEAGGGTDESGSGQPPWRVLIYNHYQNVHHSLFLLSSC